MKRLVLISNRLPVSIKKKKDEGFTFSPSVGGLATGVGSLMEKSYEGVWIGWPGVVSEKINADDRTKIETYFDEHDYHPVYLTRNEVDSYYLGFSNKTLWPLFHYFTQHTVYDEKLWKAYVRVNQKFCDEALKVIRDDDIVWVHDYQLMLVPQMLREKRPDIPIAYFLHIPFPSFEVFRLLPWRNEILQGLLGADLIGFHTFDYVRHFRSSVVNRFGYSHVLGTYTLGERHVKAETFPMGIDYEKFHTSSERDDVQREMNANRKTLGDTTLILSVDRLDYTKGILERLHSFDYFLDRNPSYKGKVTLILLAVPSRTRVRQYRMLKKQLDELVGNINGKHGTIGWVPVWYLYDSLPFEKLNALYAMADVALVTPVRDGMNLIAKEYVAAKKDGSGVLVLSEMAGAAKEMSEAIIVNPNDTKDVARSLKQALTMSTSEKKKRIRAMQARLGRYTVERWAEDFLSSLVELRQKNLDMKAKRISEEMTSAIMKRYRDAGERLIYLDYDGTLVSFRGKPEDAAPDDELLTILNDLASVDNNTVIVISGRDRQTLQDWLKDIPVTIVAEHGVWVREGADGEWGLIEPMTDEWKHEIYPILEKSMDRTPGSLIEEKDYSLVWHFREADPNLAEIRARELKEAILSLTANLNLEIMEGNKVLEVKRAGINKGGTARHFLDDRYDFIFAVGDDRTDEDTFRALPENAFTIKVGTGNTFASYSVESVTNVRNMLERMIHNS